MSLILHTNSPLTGQPFHSSQLGRMKKGVLCALSKPVQNQHHKIDDFTTFRNDYKAPPIEFVPSRGVDPVPPASVIHKNSCYLKLQNSLTQSTYKPPSETVPNVLQQYRDHRLGSDASKMDSSRMYTTHFHLSADKRLETQCTSNQNGFKAKTCDETSNHSRHVLLAKGDTSQCNPGPLGNKSFNPALKSEYFSSFTGSEGGGRSVFVKGGGCGASDRYLDKSTRNTVTGSLVNCEGGAGAGLAVTTHRSTFQGAPLQCSNSLSQTARDQQLRLTSIPQGDRAKITQPQSNHQASFSQTPSSPIKWSGGSTYNKLDAVRAINGASIRLSDHTTPAQEYFSTTATDTYRHPRQSGRTVPFVRFAPNESFLPRGDLDPARVRERINHVTTKSAHPKPPPGCFPAHVDSSNLHTLSHVDLGGSHLHSRYNSTMADSYHPISQSIKRVQAPERDNIPLDYYPGHLGHSTTTDSYPSHAGVRLDKPHPTALQNLKCSHWRLPSMGEASYGTTHRNCFSAPHK